MKDKISSAIEFATSKQFLESKVNQITSIFWIPQLTQQCKVLRGSSFKLDDKLYSLLLLKQIPKSYKLLRKIFALPNRKTLTNLLVKVPIDAGINHCLFTNLGQQIKKLHRLDRFCVPTYVWWHVYLANVKFWRDLEFCGEYIILYI